MKNPHFTCAQLSLSRVWHCFGTPDHPVNLPTVEAMLAASETNILPINTHRLNQTTGWKGLTIGFGDVHYDEIWQRASTRPLLKMLNINHQTTAEAAIVKVKLAVQLTNERVIKLEVLNPDLKTSNNSELIRAVSALRKTNSDLLLMPLIECVYEDARRLAEMGCTLLRVMGSPIGSGGGLMNPRDFARICELDVPVIIDGGVGSAEHFNLALEFGASGCLVNSMLFGNGRRPEVILREFMSQSQPFLQTVDRRAMRSEALYA